MHLVIVLEYTNKKYIAYYKQLVIFINLSCYLILLVLTKLQKVEIFTLLREKEENSYTYLLIILVIYPKSLNIPIF